ncbi:MAG: hypothetical protein M1409_03145 [Actinobacteria bacterium]|nr:hypothetical protein [Actinomycetota bacterium]
MDFIQPNKFYFFDGSSTLLPLVQNLSRSDIKDISILTANIIFQLELSMNENIKIIGLGGELNRNIKLFIEHSKIKILLVDHTKFEDDGHFTICNMKDGFSLYNLRRRGNGLCRFC